MHGEDIAFNFSDITLFSHVSVAELLQDNIFFDWILAATLVTEQQYIHGTYDEKSNSLKIGSQALITIDFGLYLLAHNVW